MMVLTNVNAPNVDDVGFLERYSPGFELIHSYTWWGFQLLVRSRAGSFISQP